MENIMKVAFVQDHFPNEQHGIFTHTHYLSKEMRLKSDLSIDIFTPLNCKDTFQREKSLSNRFTPSLLDDALCMMHEINKGGYDIIHIHGTHLPLSLIPLISKNHKVIVTLHGIVAIDSKHSLKNRLLFKDKVFSFFENQAIRKADAIIAVSPAIEAIAISKGVIANKIHVIPNGIDLNEYVGVESDLKHTSTSIFFAGRLVKSKNVRTLISSLNIVRDKNPNFHLYIAGDGPQMSNLKEQSSKLGLDSFITFLGYIYGDLKRQYYKSIDICVVPSTFESFSLVALEAMASGKPVIAANVGGLPYLVDDGIVGYLFDPMDSEDLAEKILSLLEDSSLRYKMGNAGREKAKKYQWSKIADETLKLYNDIIGTKGES